MANKAIKYRIYPTIEQSIMFAKTFGCCRKEYKLSDRSKYFVKIDKWFPSSQICSCCGNKKKLTLADRIYKCNCGLTLDRDQNAAINILNEGLRLLNEVA